MSPPQDARLGALLIILSELMFASMGATVKQAASSLSSEMLVFARNGVGLLIVLPLVWRQGIRLGSAILPLHLLRSALGVAAMYCLFYSLAHLHLAEGLLLKMTTPLFMPLIAWLWLSERANRWVLLALPTGFLGVALVLRPEGAFNQAAGIGVLGGLLAACAMVTVRRLGHSEPVTRTVFYFSLFASLVSALPLSWGWRTPQPEQWLWLLLIGLFGTLGQLLLTRGYAICAAAPMAPFTYSSVLFGSLYGYLFWRELPSATFWLGALLIAGAGIMALGRPARKDSGRTEPS